VACTLSNVAALSWALSCAVTARPDLSAFTSIGTLYSFQLNLTGLGLGTITIDLSPFQTQIAFVRGIVLAMLGLIFVITFIKHIGPSIY